MPLTAAGYTRPTLAELNTDIEAALRAKPDLGAALNLLPSAVFGMLKEVMADRESDLYEEAEACYQSKDPNTAGGASLDNLLQTVGTARLASTKSTATITLTGTPLAVIATPMTFAVAGATDDTFTLDANVTLNGGGTGTGTVTAVATGAVQALTGTLTVIVTTNPDLTSITNAADATLGRAVETDAAARLRLFRVVTDPNAAGLDDLLDAAVNVAGITKAIVFENTTDAPVSGRPAHSFETVVWDAPTTASELGDAIWEAKPAGIATHGGTSVVIIDDAGNNQTINYTVATKVTIHMRLASGVLNDASSFTSAKQAEIQAALIDQFTGVVDSVSPVQQEIGDDVFFNPMQGTVFNHVFSDGTFLVSGTFTTDTADPPVGVVDIVITDTQIAELVTANIDFT